MTNKCKKAYLDEINERKTVGVFEPGDCSNYKVEEGLGDIRRDYCNPIIKIIDNYNLPKSQREIFLGCLVQGEEAYFLKTMPINLCKLLGWKFTSVLNFLEFQSNHKVARNLIDNWVKPELDKLATVTLEQVRLDLKYITNKKVKEKLESSGLIFAVDHARYIAKQVNRLIRPKNLSPKNPPI